MPTLILHRAPFLLALGFLLGSLFPSSGHATSGAVIDTLNLNVRAGPGTGFDVVATLPQGTFVYTVGSDDGWSQVIVLHEGNSIEGWVKSTFLRLASQPPAGPTSPTPSRPTPPAISNPLTISVVDFECNESYSTEGFSDCDIDVDINVSIPPIYEPYLADQVTISCDVEVAYKTAEGFMERTVYATDSTSLFLTGGWANGSLSLKARFSYTFDPVVNARIKDASCREGY